MKKILAALLALALLAPALFGCEKNTEPAHWQTAEFETRVATFSGFPAQIIQHEVDHCDGVLI